VCGQDFAVGYSPERINPGDKIHRLENIRKIVSGMNAEALENIAAVYELIIEAGVYKAPSIKVAEAAKLVENAQRDINIAFMNETAMVFDRMGINTKDVLDAMNTKWNALGFYPGLVGGHCRQSFWATILRLSQPAERLMTICRSLLPTISLKRCCNLIRMLKNPLFILWASVLRKTARICAIRER